MSISTTIRRRVARVRAHRKFSTAVTNAPTASVRDELILAGQRTDFSF